MPCMDATTPFGVVAQAGAIADACANGCMIPSVRGDALNKTSIKPVGYGERFVKRRGLFSVAVWRCATDVVVA